MDSEARYTQKEARALGLTHYLPQKPCVRGRTSVRNTNTNRCLECGVIYKNQWANKDGDSYNAQRAVRIKYMYGITQTDYDTMLKKQGGVCAICSQPDSKGGKLPIHYSKELDRVIGLICHRCNHALGEFRSDIDLLRSAIKYLENDGSNI